MTEKRDECVLGATNRTRIKALEEQFATMSDDIKEIKDKLLGRPTWFIAIAFTAMSSLIVFLIMELARR